MGIDHIQEEQVRIDHSTWKLSFFTRSGRVTIVRRDRPSPEISMALISLGYSTAQDKLQNALYSGGKTSVTETSLNDVHGKGRQFQFSSTGRGDALELVYTVNLYDSLPFLLLRLNVANRSHGNIYLHDFNLLQADADNGGSVDFEDNYRALDFFKVGWHDWVYSDCGMAAKRISIHSPS